MKFWGKSNPWKTVQEHTDMLLARFYILKEIYPNLPVNWELLKYACLYHDIGKINKKFQAKIKKDKSIDYTNEIPHGLLSICCLDLDELEEKFTEKEIKVLVYAIAYHHERDFRKIREIIEENMQEEINLLNEELKKFKYDKINIKEAGDMEEYFNQDRIYPKDDVEMFYQYVMIKGLLNRLDYAASAGIDVEVKNNFLKEKMNGLLEEWKNKNPNSSWNKLQIFSRDNHNKNIIVTAQTGMGKTEAGLLWIGNNKGFFILPLKAAINAIYKRVTKGIAKESRLIKNIGLLHSETSEKYLSFIENDEDYQEIDFETYYTSTRQFSLPLTVCTLDQIFDFVYGYKGFEQKLATLAYSKIVIDEIQMYSPDLLAYVVKGLSHVTKVGGKFAIVTATLPPFIVDLLKKEKIDFIKSKNFTKEDLQARHSIKVVEDLVSSEKGLDLIISNYNKNKILVICNTVKEAQNIAEKLKEKLGENEKINILHSKFIRKDRAEKENEIMELGKKENKDYGIWVTTQVVEASLDIDFDILFTELSDLSGLFQRMGRCYRNRLWDKTGNNVFVFIGNEKTKNTGIKANENTTDTTKDFKGVVDGKIYKLSREVVKEKFDGIITEKEKMKYIEEIYTTENLKNSVYYKRLENVMGYLEMLEPYELKKDEVQKFFRNIMSYTIIPKNIYDENFDKINNCIEILNKRSNKDFSEEERKNLRDEKINAKKELYQFTMSVQGYELRADKRYNFYIQPKIEAGKDIIYILDCEYNNKIGYKMKKHNSEEKFMEEDNII